MSVFDFLKKPIGQPAPVSPVIALSGRGEKTQEQKKTTVVQQQTPMSFISQPVGSVIANQPVQRTDILRRVLLDAAKR
jgi:hypothetical protein